MTRPDVEVRTSRTWRVGPFSITTDTTNAYQSDIWVFGVIAFIATLALTSHGRDRYQWYVTALFGLAFWAATTHTLMGFAYRLRRWRLAKAKREVFLTREDLQPSYPNDALRRAHQRAHDLNLIDSTTEPDETEASRLSKRQAERHPPKNNTGGPDAEG